MKKKLVFSCLLAGLSWFLSTQPLKAVTMTPWWDFQSIDTMKYSRDLSRELLGDPKRLNQITAAQISEIALTGATHVAIATPYDEEFKIILEAWVKAARQQGLKVWFRGNWAGWEGWFDARPISRAEHQQKTVNFIKSHPHLFEEGDIFSACPECENGGPGDPRMTGDVAGHRAFLISEFKANSEAFRQINRNVEVTYNSMNGDVAKLVMDKETTQALGGFVVVDHYVSTPQKLNDDVNELAEQSGGTVVLGELGAPIPDIHGSMTDAQQAAWLEQSLDLLSMNPNVRGINYWTNRGGSTALWHDDGKAKPAVDTLTHFFKPRQLTIQVLNTLEQPMDTVRISIQSKPSPGDYGSYTMGYINPETPVTLSSEGYGTISSSITKLLLEPRVILSPVKPSLWYRVQVWLRLHELL